MLIVIAIILASIGAATAIALAFVSAMAALMGPDMRDPYE